MTRAVFVGRFQPFHQGHQQVVEKYSEKFGDFVVAVGSAGKSREEENPLSLEERKEILRSCFPELEIIGIEDEGDTEEDNRRWIQKLEEKTQADAVISQNSLVKRIVKEYSGMELIAQELYDPEIYSGTEIRRRMRSGEEWRYLVPGCAEEEITEKLEAIKKSGREYEFEPGWKEENIKR